MMLIDFCGLGFLACRRKNAARLAWLQQHWETAFGRSFFWAVVPGYCGGMELTSG